MRLGRSPANCSTDLSTSQQSQNLRRGALSRTVSLPSSLLLNSEGHDGGSLKCASDLPCGSPTSPFSAPATKSSATSASSQPPTSRATSFSSSSGRRRRATASSSAGSDSSDDEPDRTFTGRLGGCNSTIEVLPHRDDSNKENVAPLRAVTDAVLSLEAEQRDTEMTARRTRSGGIGTRRTSSVTSSSVSSVSIAPRMTRSRSDAVPRTPTRRRVSGASSMAAPNGSSPPSSRKRSRPSTEAASIPNTPMSRMRLDARSVASGSDDAASSYFISTPSGSSCTAQSSLFDASSQCSSACSRATTPEEREVEVAKDNTIDATKAAEYSNVYAHARVLLRYNAGTSVSHEDFDEAAVQVVGRDQERQALQAFLSRRLNFDSRLAPLQDLSTLLDGNCDSGSLYICGLPGTGKTALVRSVLGEMLSKATDGSPHVAFVNCMAVQHPRQIFVKVLAALGEEVKGASEAHIEAEAERRMDKIMQGQDGLDRAHTLVVLDEMDHLLRSRAHQNILYRLFAWASSGSSSCALVGIANSLDLTERFVPLLASKGAAPALLHFRPFESKEMVQVIKTRLTGLKARYDGEADDASAPSCPDALPLFTSAALELASRKIAAVTGDLRKALDVARLAVELVEGEQRKQALANCTVTGDGTNTEASKLLSHLTPTSAPQVTPKHVLKVLATVLGSPQLAKIRALGLQPKLILAAYVVASQRALEKMPVLGSKGSSGSSTSNVANGALRVADIESTYGAMVANDGGFTALESSEILEIFELLEVQGLLALDSSDASSSQDLSQQQQQRMAPSQSSMGVSPGGKRAAKKQMLASGRLARLQLSVEDVRKGVTTTASAFASAASSGDDQQPSQAVAVSIRRMIDTEEERIRKSRGWEQVAKDRQAVRAEELGGGRMGVSTGFE